MRRPRLALVPGEPAGVGPELCVRAAQHPRDADLVAFADRASLERAARLIGLRIDCVAPDAPAVSPGQLRTQQIDDAAEVAPGLPDPRNASTVVSALGLTADACLRGECDGLVTGPVHKATINAGGIAYSGTTELLATHAGRDVVMMLANDIVRVALATTHLPLREVADAITADGLARTLAILCASMRDDFGIADPVIAVLGLNPHAGEAGHLGREEIEVIEPVLERLRGEGMRLVGPLPADTAFLPAKLRGFDAVLAMYHDRDCRAQVQRLRTRGEPHPGLPYPRRRGHGGVRPQRPGVRVTSASSRHDTCARLARAHHATAMNGRGACSRSAGTPRQGRIASARAVRARVPRRASPPMCSKPISARTSASASQRAGHRAVFAANAGRSAGRRVVNFRSEATGPDVRNASLPVFTPKGAWRCASRTVTCRWEPLPELRAPTASPNRRRNRSASISCDGRGRERSSSRSIQTGRPHVDSARRAR